MYCIDKSSKCGADMDTSPAECYEIHMNMKFTVARLLCDIMESSTTASMKNY